jgi:hypothetical protein
MFLNTHKTTINQFSGKKIYHDDKCMLDLLLRLLEVLINLFFTIHFDRKTEKNGHFHPKMETKSRFPIAIKLAINLRFKKTRLQDDIYIINITYQQSEEKKSVCFFDSTNQKNGIKPNFVEKWENFPFSNSYRNSI